MARNGKSLLMHWFEFAPIWVLLTVGRCLPFRIRGKMFSALGEFAASNIPAARKRIHKSLKLAFPNLSNKEVALITKGVGRNTARTLSEILMNDDYKQRTELFSATGPGFKALCEANARGQGAIIVSAHFGQWEAIRHHLAAHGMETGAVYRKNNNPWYERRFLRSIEQGGSPIVARGISGNMTMLRHLKKGGFFALLVDQKYSSGKNVPFLGHDAMTTTTPAEMALRYDLLLIPVFATRQENGRNILIEYEEPMAHSNIIEMTRQINERIGNHIRKTPDQWYWLHNRWQI